MDLHEFRSSRKRKTDNLLKEDHRDLKRFFALDSAAYRDASKEGGLDEKTKELLGLVASTVLRCNDCIAYHCDRCVEVGWKKAELLDALNVALVVGGSITIPHIRTVWEVVEQLYGEKEAVGKAAAATPGLQAAQKEVTGNTEEHKSTATLTLGQPTTRKPKKEPPMLAFADSAEPAAKPKAKAAVAPSLDTAPPAPPNVPKPAAKPASPPKK